MANISRNSIMYVELYNQYKQPLVPLSLVIKDYFPHLSTQIAKRKASKQELPFPVVKFCESQKGEYFVSLIELAHFFESRSEMATREFKVLNDYKR